MIVRRTVLLLAAGALVALAGCRSAPILNVTDAPIGGNRSAQQVEQAIVEAGRSLGWQMSPQGPGRIQGNLVLRTHRATVDIAYSTKSYSISYKDSQNLDYDGSSIHKNYNGWIENLDRAIRVRLSG
jgi:hypothetical protein